MTENQVGKVGAVRGSFEQLRLQVVTVQDLLVHELPDDAVAFAESFEQAMAARYTNPRYRPRLSEIAQQLDRAHGGLKHIEAMGGDGS